MTISRIRLKSGLRIWLVILLMAKINWANGQEISATAVAEEQKLESDAEQNGGEGAEDDSYSEQLQRFSRVPLNLNEADEEALISLQALSALQIQSLLNYRRMLGNLVDIYELQAVPMWDIPTINRLRPYITISIPLQLSTELRKRFRKGDHSLLLRVSQVIEKSAGYIAADDTSAKDFNGSPQKVFFRYKYQYKNFLQYGILGEKDPGELFSFKKQRTGFDFYSVHFFVRRLGIVKALALGDYVISIGQGLVQWQGLAFRKNSDVINIKRQSAVLRPYSSAGEINFHRGAAITLEKKHFETTVFVSYKKVDANKRTDTLLHGDYVSSFLTSGLHRTIGEITDKGSIHQFVLGGNISYRNKQGHIGMNGIYYQFSLPVQKTKEPYNLYALSGKSLSDYSVEYSYTYKNAHFFGEMARSSSGGLAFLSGLLLSVAQNADMSLLYRNISPKYQSLNTNAFTENTYPVNEQGIYTGLSIRPSGKWRIDAYADLFRSPWFSYSVSGSSSGSGYLLQTAWQPSKALLFSVRYLAEKKYGDRPLGNTYLIFPAVIPKENLRIQLNYKVNSGLTIRNRNELIWYDTAETYRARGYLFYLDLIYKPLMEKYSGSFRLQYFETDSYNSRVYAYENDLLYNYSIPVFYNTGIRYYINARIRISKKASFWVKWAQTIYSGNSTIGTGIDQIQGNSKSEIKTQLQYFF